MCRILWEVRSRESMRQYLSNVLMNKIGYRAANYMAEIWQHILESGIHPEDLEGLTWSQLRRILPILEANNAKSLRNYILQNKLTLPQIEEYIAACANEEEIQAPLRYRTLAGTKEQWETIQNALARLRVDVPGASKDMEALTLICKGWLAIQPQERIIKFPETDKPS